MSTNTATELAAVAATQSAVDAMAVVTLSPEKYAAEVYQPFKATLASAIDSVRAIDYDITTTAGMAVAVKARATFRDLRIAADKERKARKEPITKIGKLLESGFDQVEERIAPLEELFGADIKAEEERKETEKAAKIAVERARTEAIQSDIAAIREVPFGLDGAKSCVIKNAIDALEEIEATEARFAEFTDDAAKMIAATMDRLIALHTGAEVAEAAALAAEEARLAEVARIEQERATLAAQRAENERIANEHAITAKRLADQEAAQALAAKVLADKAAANLKAERDAQELAMRLEREAQAEAQRKANEELKAAQDKLAASQAAHEAAIAKQRADAQREADHAEAIEMDAAFNAAMARAAELKVGEYAADMARCTEVAQAMLTNGRSLVGIIDTDIDSEEMTDEDIIDFGAECGLDKLALILRLEAFCVRARAEMVVSA